MCLTYSFFSFFFFNDTAPTKVYTLSLHDALPISLRQAIPSRPRVRRRAANVPALRGFRDQTAEDRKSTRLNSSHVAISYAVFCLKKKKKNKPYTRYKRTTNTVNTPEHTHSTNTKH